MDLHVLTEAAAAYDACFVPALFERWASTMVDAAGARRGARALDVACGTGVLTRALAAAVGAEGAVTGLDRNPGMLAVAARRAPAIDWREGLAEALPFADGTFDVVTCQFGLMFFDDPAQAVREMWRVLRPGGRFAVAVWATLRETPAYADELELVERLAGDGAAAALTAPFVLGDAGALEDVCPAAGVPVSVTTHLHPARFPSIRGMVEPDLRGWLPLMGHALPEPTIASILTQAEVTLAPYRRPDGSVEFAMPGHVAVAVRPGRDSGAAAS